MVSIENVVATFEVEGKVKEYVPFGNGHINDTRLVTMDNAYVVLHKEIGALEHVLVDSLENVLYAVIHSYESGVVDMTVSKGNVLNNLAFNVKGSNNFFNSNHFFIPP